jgi:hypothetical protein
VEVKVNEFRMRHGVNVFYELKPGKEEMLTEENPTLLTAALQFFHQTS